MSRWQLPRTTFSAASGSILQPGSTNDTGTLMVSGNIHLEGTLILNLNRTNAQRMSSLVSTGGTITAGGTLIVSNIGPVLAFGDTFQLFNTGASGFASIVLPTNDPDHNLIYTWDNNLASSGSITVSSVTSCTDPTNLTFVFSDGNVTFSWPSNHIGWKLQVQTNTLTVGISTNAADWVTLTNYVNTNQAVLPLGTNDAVFYRMVYP